MSFDLICRISEVLQIETEKVVLPGQHILEESEELTILWEGSNSMKNGEKGIPVIDKRLEAWLTEAVKQARGSNQAKIFRTTAASVRSKFKDALQELGLERYGYVVHSVRAGGTVHCHLISKWSLESTRHRGGWKSTDQIDTYLQIAKFHRNANSFPRHITEKFEDEEKTMSALLVLAQSTLDRGVGRTKNLESQTQKEKKRKNILPNTS